jgi:hypothetical protein
MVIPRHHGAEWGQWRDGRDWFYRRDWFDGINWRSGPQRSHLQPKLCANQRHGDGRSLV